MKSFHLSFYVLIALGALLLTACGAVATPPPVQPTIIIITPTPLSPPAGALPTPAAPTPAVTVASQYAPFCPSAASSSCTAPTIEERDRYCVKKVPYTLVAIPLNATYEVLSSGFSCEKQAVVNNEQILACTGKQLYTFDLKLCNSACAAPTAAAGGGQCPSGYVYNATQKCCAQANPDAGCVTVQVAIGGCTNP